MNEYEYITGSLPYSFLAVLLILKIAIQLRFKSFPYSIGMFWLIWANYQFVLMPVSGYFLFPERMHKGSDLAFYLAHGYMLLYLVSISVGMKFFAAVVKKPRSNASAETSVRFSVFSPNSMSIMTAYFFYGCGLAYFLIENYLNFGTIDSWKIISTPSLADEENVRAGQLSGKIFLNAFNFVMWKTAFCLLISGLLYRRKVTLSLLILVIQLYIELSLKSKYILVSPIVWVSLYSILVRRVRIYYVLGGLGTTAFLVIFFMNNIRHNGIDGAGSFEFAYMLERFVWRGDFFHGFQILVAHMIDDKSEHWLGASMFAAFLRFIPRSLLPERLGSSDKEITIEVFGAFENDIGWALNFGGLGEFYFNFGLIGVVLAGLYAALLLGTGTTVFVRAVERRNWVLLGAVMASPIWQIPWSPGVNDFFARQLYLWIISLTVFFVFSMCSNFLVKSKRGSRK